MRGGRGVRRWWGDQEGQGRGRCVGEVTPEAYGENQEARSDTTERYGGKPRDHQGGEEGACAGLVGSGLVWQSPQVGDI